LGHRPASVSDRLHNEERIEVKTRLARLIQGEEMPSHFDATLISLLEGVA
jgi:hypothetical protein